MLTWVSTKPVNVSVSRTTAKSPGDGAENFSLLLECLSLDTEFQLGGAGGRNVLLLF